MTPLTTAARPVTAAIPAAAGVGLKPLYYQTILDQHPEVGWFEVHPENYMGEGGPPHYYLTAIRERYPLALHGVGLSLGGAKPLDQEHLQRLAALVQRYEPGLFSEHLAWSTHSTGFLNDLLPLPYTESTLAHVARHIDQVQTTLQRSILIENPATYVRLADSAISETQFLAELAQNTGCGLLLDVNNVQVCATNHGFDPVAYIQRFPVQYVAEIHLAGHVQRQDDAGHPLLIDSHDAPVTPGVWNLLERSLQRTGPVPVLLERDSSLPPWAELWAEVQQVAARLRQVAVRTESFANEEPVCWT